MRVAKCDSLLYLYFVKNEARRCDLVSVISQECLQASRILNCLI